jgi:hypothetical protein
VSSFRSAIVSENGNRLPLEAVPVRFWPARGLTRWERRAGYWLAARWLAAQADDKFVRTLEAAVEIAPMGQELGRTTFSVSRGATVLGYPPVDQAIAVLA